METITLKLNGTVYTLEHTPSGEVRIEIDNDRVHFLSFEHALRLAFGLALRGAVTAKS